MVMVISCPDSSSSSSQQQQQHHHHHAADHGAHLVGCFGCCCAWSRQALPLQQLGC
jgi:hypothetical protein